VTDWRAALNFILIDLAENQSLCNYRGLKQLIASCEILVASVKVLVALATRKAQFRPWPKLIDC